MTDPYEGGDAIEGDHARRARLMRRLREIAGALGVPAAAFFEPDERVEADAGPGAAPRAEAERPTE